MNIKLLTVDKQRAYAKQGWLVSDNSATLLHACDREDVPINPFYRAHVSCAQCNEPVYIEARRKVGNTSTVTYGFSCPKCESAFIHSFVYDRCASVSLRCEAMCLLSGGLFSIDK